MYFIYASIVHTWKYMPKNIYYLSNNHCTVFHFPRLRFFIGLYIVNIHQYKDPVPCTRTNRNTETAISKGNRKSKIQSACSHFLYAYIMRTQVGGLTCRKPGLTHFLWKKTVPSKEYGSWNS